MLLAIYILQIDHLEPNHSKTMAGKEVSSTTSVAHYHNVKMLVQFSDGAALQGMLCPPHSLAQEIAGRTYSPGARYGVLESRSTKSTRKMF